MVANDETKIEWNGNLTSPFSEDELGEDEEYDPKEVLAHYKTLNTLLNQVVAENIPFVSSYKKFPEFSLLQESTIQRLLEIEKKLYDYALDAGLSIFKKGIKDFFLFESENLLEMESEGLAFFDTFRYKHLLNHGQYLFKEVAEQLQDEGIPSQPELLHVYMGSCYSNKLYPLYTYLYEDAPKEKKRAIQSTLQQHGITVKDLKKCSRVKSN
ncbi:hypothetical protein [Planomicrobium okeanokoites]|uniref:hypothetical protein n=1 Tax=Planomicrobium okeanokoites TaxID=244 RepID=UPI0024927E2B|nr:hypothetical protein [Planomicrobium okeanokoites]